MRVSLVIPTWNAGPLLERVLAAVDRQPGADDLERLAVDSGSRDDTVAILERHGFSVHHVDQRDFDHGATRDLAIERTHGEVIVLLTQDAIPADREWLPRLLECYEDPAVGAAYCRQIPRPDCNPLIARRISEWTAGRTEPVVQRIEGLEEYERLEPLERLRRCAFDNVAGSVRRRVWEPIRFGRRPFGEDVAFGKRVVLAGHTIVYQPRSAVVHSHDRTPLAEGKRIFCDHQNLQDLFGVRVLPTLRHFRDAVRSGRAEFRAMVETMELPAERKRALHRWARRYAFWSALGIYLGGNSDRFGRGWRAPLFALVDRFMHRGI